MTSEVEVRPSAIEGLGVFAARPFRAGERIRRVNVLREVTPEAPLREDLGERADHCNYPDGKVVLYGSPDRHLNHSCDPNAYETFEGDATYLRARRDIPTGAEITCDYNVNIANGTSWPCRCGAARCRGLVAGDFFLLPPEWQREYRPLLAGWFVRRHHERVRALDSAAAGGRPDRLRTAGLVALAAGAAASVAITAFVGRRNPSRLLVAAFVAWVLSPFAALAWAHVRSRRWPSPVGTTLSGLMLVVALGSLAAYGHRLLGPPRAQAAFVFVVVPPAAWLLGAAALALARRAARSQATRDDSGGSADAGAAGTRGR